MTPLLENILIGLGTGLFSGLITGFYSSLIISRRNRFSSLQAELLRHTNSIEYMQEPGRVSVNRGSSNQILYIASDLAHFGHRSAAELVMAANKQISTSFYEAEAGRIDSSTLEKAICSARDTFRDLNPSYKIYLPSGRV